MTSHISESNDEVKLVHQRKISANSGGQIFVILALILPVLLVFVALSIDFGMAYMTKTTLSKSVDAAALAAMKNYSQGESTAAALASNVFVANYDSIPGLGTATVPTMANGGIAWTVDAENDTTVTVTASAVLNTYFLGVLGTSYKTISITDSATAMRNPMIMSLVLDTSTSMTRNGGETYLAGAVEDFINDFDPNDNDTTDYVSVTTFGTYAYNNQTMTQPLKNPVDEAMASCCASGTGTNWSVTNYTNSFQGLVDGQVQIANQYAKAPAGSNVLKVLVFFTDGWPNIQQDTLTCPSAGGGGSNNFLYCGCDPGDESLTLCKSNNLVYWNPASCTSSDNCPSQYSSGCGSAAENCNTGGAGTISGCPELFPDQQMGGSEPLITTSGSGASETYTGNIQWCGGANPSITGKTLASDAMYRAAQVSLNSSASYPGSAYPGLLYQNVYVYSIGMGSAIAPASGSPDSLQEEAEEFLREVANDPNATTYNPSLPIGEADFAGDSEDLDTVFQIIASKILLRLSR